MQKKISTTIDVPARKLGLRQAAQILRQTGFTHVDYGRPCSAYEYKKGLFALPRAEFEAVFLRDRQVLAECGLCVGQVHAPFPTYPDDPSQFDFMAAAIERSIYAAQFMGSPYLVIHCALPCRWQPDDNPARTREMNLALFNALLPAAKMCGVTLALENMPGQGIPTSTPQMLIDYIDAVQSPFFAACLDTGHANMTGVSPADFAQSLGQRLQVLHVHDNNGVRDEHCAPYLGTVDWDAFARALRAVGYGGTFSLESDALPEKLPPALYGALAAFGYAAARHILDLCV